MFPVNMTNVHIIMNELYRNVNALHLCKLLFFIRVELYQKIAYFVHVFNVLHYEFGYVL